MTMSKDDLKKNLAILQINIVNENDIDSVNASDVNNAFKKLALVLHPDKAGDKTTAAFQDLRSAFEKLRNHFQDTGDGAMANNDSDDEHRFFDENFEKHLNLQRNLLLQKSSTLETL